MEEKKDAKDICKINFVTLDGKTYTFAGYDSIGAFELKVEEGKHLNSVSMP